MSFSGDPRIPKVQLPSTPPPQPAPEKEVGKMGEHSVREDRSSQISAPEQEGEKVSQLAQERLLQEVESTKQLSEQHIVEQSAQKTPTEDDVDKIRQSQLPHSEQQTSLVQESTSASPIISGSVVVRESQKKSPRDQVETEIIPSIVPTGESAAPRSLLTRMAEMKVPGVSVAVIDKGEVVWSEGYGELDEKKHPGVLTQAASVSKVVTALTVLSLCQDGILDLDQDVGQFFREKLGQEGEAIWRQIYSDDSEDPRVPKVTIRMLLSHTSGIPRGGSEYYSIEQIDRQFLIDVSTLVQDFKLLDKKEYSSVKSSLEELVALQEKGKISRSDGINQKITDKQKEVLSALTSIASTLPAEQIPSFNERLVRLTASHECHKEAAATPVPSLDAILLGNDKKLGPIRVARRPGEHFEYSNPGFTILQKVVQLASEKKDFAYEVQKRVLGPLHMDDSTYSPPLERAVLGNDTDGKPLAESWRLLPHLAAGGLWTSSRDLAKVILAIQGALAGIPLPGQDKPLISKDLAQIMEQGTDVSRKKSYGLGLMIDIVGQEGQPTTYFSHNGQIRGFRTIVIANELHPEDIEHTGKGVVILTNSLNGEDFYPEIIRAVAKAYNWPDREKIPVCELRVQPSELYASAQEANAPSNKAVWATRVGTYESVLDGVHYYVDVSIEEDSGKVHFLAYEENDGRKIEEGAITCIPIGSSVAYHSPDVQGPFDVVKFTTEGEKTHVDVFGARYTRIPFE